jgi:hypothetical protein
VDVTLIVLIIFAITTLFSVYNLFRSFSVGNLVSTSISVVFLILGFLMYQDVTDFRENFIPSPKTFVLQDDGMVLAGFTGTMGEDELPRFLTADDIAAMQQAYAAGDAKAMLGDSYKLFIINLSAFSNVSGDIKVEEQEYSYGKIAGWIRSATPLDDFADDLLARENIPADQYGAVRAEVIAALRKDAPSDTEFKASLFGLLLGHAIDTEGAAFLLVQYKLRRIAVHPMTITFRIIRILPMGYLDQLVEEPATETGPTPAETAGSPPAAT